jgi:hypothetical protein
MLGGGGTLYEFGPESVSDHGGFVWTDINRFRSIWVFTP